MFLAYPKLMFEKSMCPWRLFAPVWCTIIEIIDALLAKRREAQLLGCNCAQVSLGPKMAEPPSSNKG